MKPILLGLLAAYLAYAIPFAIIQYKHRRDEPWVIQARKLKPGYKEKKP